MDVLVVLVSAPVSWMGLGLALQRAALLDGPLRPRSELVRHNSRHNIPYLSCPILFYSILFCSIPCARHESNNDESNVHSLKCQGFFSSKNTFNDTERLQVETGYYFYFSEFVSELMLTSISTMQMCSQEQADAFFTLA